MPRAVLALVLALVTAVPAGALGATAHLCRMSGRVMTGCDCDDDDRPAAPEGDTLRAASCCDVHVRPAQVRGTPPDASPLPHPALVATVPGTLEAPRPAAPPVSWHRAWRAPPPGSTTPLHLQVQVLRN